MKVLATLAFVLVIIQNVISSKPPGNAQGVAQIGLSTRNILNPNVIGQTGTITIANAAEIIATILANNGNNVATQLNGAAHSSKSKSSS